PLCARIPTVTGSNLFHLLLCGAPNLTGCSVTHATGQRARDSVAKFYGLINSFSVEAFDTLSSCFSPITIKLASNFFDNTGQEITDTGSRVIIFNTLLPPRYDRTLQILRWVLRFRTRPGFKVQVRTGRPASVTRFGHRLALLHRVTNTRHQFRQVIVIGVPII